MIDEVIKGLPIHFQKEETIKFIRCLKPVFEYLNDLSDNLKNQTSLLECSGIFLDFMGKRYNEERMGRNDDKYREALIIKKTSLGGLPNTEFLLDITRKLTNREVTEIETRYKGEVASQLFKVDMLEKLQDISKMPDLNKVVEAGAIMYWNLDIISENMGANFGSLAEFSKIIDIKADFKIDQTVRISENTFFANVVGFTKVIDVGGVK